MFYPNTQEHSIMRENLPSSLLQIDGKKCRTQYQGKWHEGEILTRSGRRKNTLNPLFGLQAQCSKDGKFWSKERVSCTCPKKVHTPFLPPIGLGQEYAKNVLCRNSQDSCSTCDLVIWWGCINSSTLFLRTHAHSRDSLLSELGRD